MDKSFFMSGLTTDLMTKLIAPSSALKDPRKQIEAKLISALLLPTTIITSLGLIVSLAGLLSYENLLLEWVVIIALIGYVFSRTRYYLVGGLLLLLNGSFWAYYNSCFWSFNSESLMHPLFWLVATVMLGGFWLRPKALVLLGVIEVGMISTIPAASEHVDFIMLKEFLPYFIITISLVTISTVIRDYDKKKIEEQATKIRDSEAFLKNIIHSMHDSLITLNGKGYISTINSSALDLLGYEESELIGMPGAVLMATEEAEFTESVVDQKTDLILHQNLEKNFITKSGEQIPVILSTSAILEDSNKHTGLVMVAKNMSKQKQLETQLRHSQKMEAVGTLASGIAHEFNNILSTILGYVEMMLKKKLGLEKINQYLKSIGQEGWKAAELVEQILTFSRAGKSELKSLKISSIIEETLKMLQVSLPDIIQIQSHIDPDCARIMGNATQIQQVVLNFCLNTAHAMKEDGGILDVRLEQAESNPEKKPAADIYKNTYLKLSVSDTGNGMTPEVKDRIFDPFFTTKEIGEGTGLGLSVVHSIVENHKGEIEVETAPGEGTKFTVFFPVAEEL